MTSKINKKGSPDLSDEPFPIKDGGYLLSH
jgi:hypothetical protein